MKNYSVNGMFVLFSRNVSEYIPHISFLIALLRWFRGIFSRIFTTFIHTLYKFSLLCIDGGIVFLGLVASNVDK